MSITVASSLARGGWRAAFAGLQAGFAGTPLGTAVRADPLQILPEGFALPPFPYLLAFVVLGGAVGYGLVSRDPDFRAVHVLALVPWMIAGAAGHVLYVLDTVPSSFRPLFGTPSVYVTAAILAGAVWLTALATDRPVPRELAATGSLFALLSVGGVLGEGLARGTFAPLLPTLGLVGGGALGWIVVRLLQQYSEDVTLAGRAATLAVVAHGVDGVTTAVGIDLLGFGERTPLSALIIEFAAGLPTADALGSGWLFVIVKLLIAGLAVAAIAPTVRDAEREGYALLTLVTAVGLGPGVHNALLFTVAG
jgi:uncharacterized membrane protein